jgi:nucleolar protein 53
MGKKPQGAKLRANKRAKLALEELQESQAHRAATTSVTHKPDEQLFTLDTGGLKQLPASLQLKKKQSKKDIVSKLDQDLIKKLKSKHTEEELHAIAEQGRAKFNQQRKGKRLDQKTKTDFDLWDNCFEAETEETTQDVPRPGIGSALAGLKTTHKLTRAKKFTTKTLKPSIAIDVAKDGQSYNPDPVSHKKLMDEAVSLEIKRDLAIQDRKTPLATGLSAETRALLVGDSSSESESDSDDDNANLNLAVGPLVQRADKLTRAQRNKRKRLRDEEMAHKRAKMEKKLEKQVGELPRYKKELKNHTPKVKPEKPTRVLGKDVEQLGFAQDPIRALTVPVALQAAGSLRRAQPKGSLLHDRQASLRDRNLTAKANAGERKVKRKRKLAVKGKKNNEAVGGNTIIMG